MSTSIDAADCELSRLLELERRDVADAGGLLRWRLGAARPEYLVMRADVAKVMSRVALFYKAGWDAAHLGMALLDTYYVRGGRLAPELAGFALLWSAVCYVDDPGASEVEGKKDPEERSLSMVVQRWQLVVQALELGWKERPAFFSQPLAVVCSFFKDAQAQVLAVVGWRLNRATANVLLKSMLELNLHADDDEIDGRKVTEQERAQVSQDAQTFCSMAVLRGFSYLYTHSVVAVACLQAARHVYGIRPVWTSAFGASCRTTNQQIVDSCVRELVSAYHEERSHEHRECPQTPKNERTACALAIASVQALLPEPSPSPSPSSSSQASSIAPSS